MKIANQLKWNSLKNIEEYDRKDNMTRISEKISANEMVVNKCVIDECDWKERFLDVAIFIEIMIKGRR